MISVKANTHEAKGSVLTIVCLRVTHLIRWKEIRESCCTKR